MQITLEKPEYERFVLKQVHSGQFVSSTAVIEAALQRMMAEELAPGELQRLVDEGEESIRREGTIPLDEAMRQLKEISAAARSRAGK